MRHAQSPRRQRHHARGASLHRCAPSAGPPAQLGSSRPRRYCSGKRPPRLLSCAGFARLECVSSAESLHCRVRRAHCSPWLIRVFPTRPAGVSECNSLLSAVKKHPLVSPRPARSARDARRGCQSLASNKLARATPQSRPLTHDLMKNCFEALEYKVSGCPARLRTARAPRGRSSVQLSVFRPRAGVDGAGDTPQGRNVLRQDLLPQGAARSRGRLPASGASLPLVELASPLPHAVWTVSPRSSSLRPTNTTSVTWTPDHPMRSTSQSAWGCVGPSPSL